MCVWRSFYRHLLGELPPQFVQLLSNVYPPSKHSKISSLVDTAETILDVDQSSVQLLCCWGWALNPAGEAYSAPPRHPNFPSPTPLDIRPFGHCTPSHDIFLSCLWSVGEPMTGRHSSVIESLKGKDGCIIGVLLERASPSLPLDNIGVMVIVWMLRGNIIRTAVCWIVWHNVHSPHHTYMSSSYRSNRLGLSHWDPYTVRRGGCLELYYCNMMEWFWWDSSLIFDDQLVSFSALTLLVWSSGL